MASQTLLHSDSQLPVVDFTNESLKPGTETWLSSCQVVRKALEDHGAFLALYDKLSPEHCSSVTSVMEELFNLPLETKRKETSDKPLHGYYGQISFLPLYESVSIDNPLTVEGCQKFSNIMWGKENDRFCNSVNEYSKLVEELEHVVMRMVFESYGVDRQRCDSLLESNNYLLRCFKYRTPQKDETNLGIHSHSDLTMLSVLHQLNNLSGLQIKLKNGEWVGIDASLSSFVVMAGDAFAVWSNGRIKPCEHRVIMNETATRYSTGLFSFASKTVQTPEELIDEEHPLRFKPFDHYGFLRFYQKEKITESDARIQAYCGV